MDTQLPSLTELGQAQFIDPMYFNQVQNQIGLGNQFAQQNLDKGAQDLQAKTLQNLYDEQRNPLLLQQQGLLNTSQQQKNDLGAIDVNQRQALAPQEKAAKLAKYLSSASDDEVSRLGSEAEAKAMKLAPLAAAGDEAAAAELEKVNIMRDQVDKVRSAKASQSNQLENTRLLINGRQGVADTKAAASERVANLNNNMKDIISQRLSANNAAKLAAMQNKPMSMDQRLSTVMDHYAQEQDPDQKAALLDYANSLQQIIVAQKPFAAGLDIPGMTDAPKVKVPGIAPVSVAPPANSPNGAGGRGNQVPPISSEVFNQNSGAPSTPPADAARAAQDVVAIQRELNDPRTTPETRKVLLAQLAATQKVAATASAATPHPELPPGSKQIGTSGGKPVYQTPDGKKFIGS